jgi:hypothetical protein
MPLICGIDSGEAAYWQPAVTGYLGRIVKPAISGWSRKILGKTLPSLRLDKCSPRRGLRVPE